MVGPRHVHAPSHETGIPRLARGRCEQQKRRECDGEGAATTRSPVRAATMKHSPVPPARASMHRALRPMLPLALPRRACSSSNSTDNLQVTPPVACVVPPSPHTCVCCRSPSVSHHERRDVAPAPYWEQSGFVFLSPSVFSLLPRQETFFKGIDLLLTVHELYYGAQTMACVDGSCRSVGTRARRRSGAHHPAASPAIVCASLSARRMLGLHRGCNLSMPVRVSGRLCVCVCG